MSKFNCNITITASDKADAQKKLKALKVLSEHLYSNELTKLALVVQNDPVTTKLAKKALGL